MCDIISKKKAIQYYNDARDFANRHSKDCSTKVGAVFLKPKKFTILASGFNGLPRGIEDTPERWTRPEKYQWVEHAERNCIYNAASSGPPLGGSIAVVTLFPCVDCTRAMIQIGISLLVTTKTNEAAKRWGESWRKSEVMFAEAQIPILILTSEEINSKIDPTFYVDNSTSQPKTEVQNQTQSQDQIQVEDRTK